MNLLESRTQINIKNIGKIILNTPIKMESCCPSISIVVEHIVLYYNVSNYFISRCLTLRCKLYFDNLLSQRAYCGKMNFDHKNETLSISVSILTPHLYY